jgi:serine/threonine-protein kinase
MRTDVIGSRYRLGSVVTCTPEATTWDARDTWLDERVLVVTPEPGCDERFAALAGAVLDRSSSHLVGLYDIGATADDFVVFGVPAATLSDEQAPREEEDVLLAGRALGDALEALHERGVVHGDLHPGSVVMAGSGDAALSPWPLAPRPHNWSGPGGFGTDPDEPRVVSPRDDVRALGAVLLGALAGPPVLSSEQVANIERELAGRAPNAVTIADRALTSPARGGYAVAAEVRDDCAAVLAGRPVAATVSDLPAKAGTGPAAAGAESEVPEGRRAALVLAASGAALFAGFGFAGSIGAGPHAPARPVTTQASGCAVHSAMPRCLGPDGARAGATAARPVAAVPARFADHSGAAGPARASGAPATVSTATPSTSATAVRPPGTSTTTSPPSTTTSSSPSTTTTAPTATTTTAPTTTTTAPPSTTTSSSNVMQAGSSGSDLWSGRGPGGGPEPGQGH